MGSQQAIHSICLGFDVIPPQAQVQHHQYSGVDGMVVILHGPGKLHQIVQVSGEGGEILSDVVISEHNRLLLICHTSVNFEDVQPWNRWHQITFELGQVLAPDMAHKPYIFIVL